MLQHTVAISTFWKGWNLLSLENYVKVAHISLPGGRKDRKSAASIVTFGFMEALIAMEKHLVHFTWHINS